MNKTNILYLTLSLVLLMGCTNAKSEKQNKTQEECSTPKRMQLEKKERQQTVYYLNDLEKVRSLEKIKELFPTDSIAETVEFIEEGTIELWVTHIYLSNKQTLNYYWQPGKKYQSLHKICVYTSAYFGEESTIHKNSKYDIKLSVDSPQKEKNDIYLGMSMEELEKTIGTFEFCGFEWDGSGMVIREGKKELEHITISLGLPQTSTKEQEIWSNTPAYKRLIGDGQFKSSNKDALKLNLQVIYMAILK